MPLKTRVIQTPLVPKSWILAITLFGLVFTRDRSLVNERVLNHELIHCHQQLEWLYIPFFVLYGFEWLVQIIAQILHGHRPNSRLAYRQISFEREAYAHQNDPHYLKHRKIWANYRGR